MPGKRKSALARVGLGLALAVALPATPACNTDAVGIDACRNIENARCRRAPACGLDLSRAVRERGDDVESCIRFYRDACLHGLVSKVEPGTPALDGCLAVINTGTCDVVLKPEIDPACAFLIPPPPAPSATTPPVDAGPG